MCNTLISFRKMSGGNLLCSKPCHWLSRVKKCSMDSVVVYKDRAEVKRNVTINIPAGESEVMDCLNLLMEIKYHVSSNI